MKKILSILISILFITIHVFAEYKPIPQNCSIKFSEEINKTLKKQIPISKKEINNIILEIENEKNSYERSYLISDGINSVLFKFYMELINIADKYVNIKSTIPATDGYGALQEVITPYLNANNIEIKKINEFIKYAETKQIKLEEKYYQ